MLINYSWTLVAAPKVTSSTGATAASSSTLKGASAADVHSANGSKRFYKVLYLDCLVTFMLRKWGGKGPKTEANCSTKNSSDTFSWTATCQTRQWFHREESQKGFQVEMWTWALNKQEEICILNTNTLCAAALWKSLVTHFPRNYFARHTYCLW